MTAFLVAALLVAIYAVMAAGKHKINDHWDGSLFARLSGGDDTHFFGHRDNVWLRRYVGRDSSNPKLGIFRIPVVGTLAVAVWDFYHLAGTVQLVTLIAACLAIAAMPAAAVAWWWGPVFLIQYWAVFETFYRGVFA